MLIPMASDTFVKSLPDTRSLDRSVTPKSSHKDNVKDHLNAQGKPVKY